jgi:dCMP deaminase
MERVSRDELCMQIAHLVAQRGTCSRAQVGAVIARDGRVLATGYNGPPSGFPHCTDPDGCTGADRKSNEGCLRAVHAEANAIAYSARHGIATEGASLYCSHLPCRKCAELIINAGIVLVYYSVDYRLKDGWLLLQQAGIDMIQL